MCEQPAPLRRAGEEREVLKQACSLQTQEPSLEHDSSSAEDWHLVHGPAILLCMANITVTLTSGRWPLILASDTCEGCSALACPSPNLDKATMAAPIDATLCTALCSSPFPKVAAPQVPPVLEVPPMPLSQMMPLRLLGAFNILPTITGNCNNILKLKAVS